MSAFQEHPQSRDDLGIPVGDVGQGAFLDLALLAVGLAHEDGGRGIAVGDEVDMHDDENTPCLNQCKRKTLHYMATIPAKIGLLLV